MLDVFANPGPPDLSHIVRRYIVVRGELPAGFVYIHSTLPSLMEAIFFNLSETRQYCCFGSRRFEVPMAMVNGLVTQKFDMEFSGKVLLIGAELNPSTLFTLFDLSPRALVDNVVALSELAGRATQQFIDDLLRCDTTAEQVAGISNFIREKLAGKSAARREVTTALSVIEKESGTLSIPLLLKNVKLSERTLLRLFNEQVGLSPKSYNRLVRFKEAVKMIGRNEGDWHHIVHRLNYFDQSHFIRDFKAIAGRTPGEHLQQSTDIDRFFFRP